MILVLLKQGTKLRRAKLRVMYRRAQWQGIESFESDDEIELVRKIRLNTASAC
jgi:hypothetical protein